MTDPQPGGLEGCQAAITLNVDPEPPEADKKCTVTMAVNFTKSCEEPSRKYKLYVRVTIQVDPMTQTTRVYGQTQWKDTIPEKVEFTPSSDDDIVKIEVQGEWKCEGCNNHGEASKSWSY